MSRSVLDLTPAELDKLARDAWSDAARQALERGLPISGSRDGRRFRYYPDRRIEDLGPTGGTTATVQTRMTATVQTMARPNISSPELHFQGDEFPEAYREMAEVRFSQATDAYQKTTAEVQTAAILAFAEKSVSLDRDNSTKIEDNGTIEAVLMTASKGANEYSAKLMEMMKASTTASLDFAQELLGIKSPSEAVELWTSHAKKQSEAVTAQAKELAELSQRIAEEAKMHPDVKGSKKDSSVA